MEYQQWYISKEVFYFFFIITIFFFLSSLVVLKWTMPQLLFQMLFLQCGCTPVLLMTEFAGASCCLASGRDLLTYLFLRETLRIIYCPLNRLWADIQCKKIVVLKDLMLYHWGNGKFCYWLKRERLSFLCEQRSHDITIHKISQLSSLIYLYHCKAVFSSPFLL